MPTYVYECEKCGERIEVFQGINDPPLKKCNACAGKLKKVFLPVSIVFKGAGFYATDSRKGSPSTAIPSDTGSSATSTTEKTETKSTDDKASTPAAEPAAKAT
jgi:putative FmdB family regulatory protein